MDALADELRGRKGEFSKLPKDIQREMKPLYTSPMIEQAKEYITRRATYNSLVRVDVAYGMLKKAIPLMDQDQLTEALQRFHEYQQMEHQHEPDLSDEGRTTEDRVGQNYIDSVGEHAWSILTGDNEDEQDEAYESADQARIGLLRLPALNYKNLPTHLGKSFDRFAASLPEMPRFEA